jgi:hypothetical protein
LAIHYSLIERDRGCQCTIASWLRDAENFSLNSPQPVPGTKEFTKNSQLNPVIQTQIAAEGWPEDGKVENGTEQAALMKEYVLCHDIAV